MTQISATGRELIAQINRAFQNAPKKHRGHLICHVGADGIPVPPLDGGIVLQAPGDVPDCRIFAGDMVEVCQHKRPARGKPCLVRGPHGWRFTTSPEKGEQIEAAVVRIHASLI